MRSEESGQVDEVIVPWLADEGGRVYYYCTHFDRNYLNRGLALYQSLKQYCPAFRLWVLCLDSETYAVLAQCNLPEVRLIALEDFERSDLELLQAKQNRSLVEYYFTCTPSLPLFVLKRHSEIDIITYLDADLFFFADPAPLYAEMEGKSIAIVGHRFPKRLRYLEILGVYNVGWLSFRQDEHGMACLEWWRERCLEWCYDRLEEGRFADQKYLDEWPQRFQNVIVLQHKGANLAAYNLANYKLRLINGQIWVDEYPLVFFHFHALKQMRQWLFASGLSNYRVFPSRIVRKEIYGLYIRTLTDNRLTVSFSTLRTPQPRKSRLKDSLRTIKKILSRNYIISINGKSWQ